MKNQKIIWMIIAVVILLLGVVLGLKAFSSGDSSEENSDTYEISAGGSYDITGNNKCIVIKTDEEVTLKLNNANISCSDGPAINGQNAGNVNIVLTGDNVITSTTDDDLDSAIYLVKDLNLSGSGNVTITSNYKGIRANGKIVIDGGTYNIDAEEGIEGTYIVINDGTFDINASDDGINASDKSDDYTPTLIVNGGDITVTMAQGDSDGFDSNGDLIINGGTISITCQSPFDYDGVAEYNGGTIIVNGQETNKITNQFEGEGMGGPGGNPRDDRR